MHLMQFLMLITTMILRKNGYLKIAHSCWWCYIFQIAPILVGGVTYTSCLQVPSKKLIEKEVERQIEKNWKQVEEIFRKKEKESTKKKYK